MIVYKGRLLKTFNWKLKLALSMLVFTWFPSNIAFHLLLIWLQNLVAGNSELRIVPGIAYCHLNSLCCLIQIWPDSIFRDRLSIEICCFAQDSIWNMRIVSMPYFYSKDLRMIERSSKAMGVAFVGNKFLPIP